MPIVRCSEAETHEIHGARFVSYAAPRTGSRELCAWRGEIPAGTKAPAHTVDREEILHLLTGELLITLDGRTERVTAGDTVIVNPGATLAVENPTGPDRHVLGHHLRRPDGGAGRRHGAHSPVGQLTRAGVMPPATPASPPSARTSPARGPRPPRSGGPSRPRGRR